MHYRSWIFITTIYILAAVVTGISYLSFQPTQEQLVIFGALTVLATLAQLFKVEAPNNVTYFATLIFLAAGIILLHPFLFAAMVIIAYSIEWVKERLINSHLLRKWYIQPFNISMHILAGTAARWVYYEVENLTTALPQLSLVMAVLLAMAAYVLINHLLLGLVRLLSQRVFSIRESGMLDPENLLPDLILLYLGYIVTILWEKNPLLIILALSPLVLMYRALMIPKLKQEAHTDSKTGLYNARQFTTLFAAELERAKRNNLSLAIIMADLDLLRNINNTYGHLAGDTVLAQIGLIIRKTKREKDIAARFGGEEFAILLQETDLTEAQLFAERLREAVEAADFEIGTSPTPIRVTMSLGVACYPDDALDANSLVHEADVAVYQAKLRGRNRVICASDVPQSIKLETTPDRIAHPYAAAFMPRPRAIDGTLAKADKGQAASPTEKQSAETKTPVVEQNRQVVAEQASEPATPPKRGEALILPLYAGSIIVTGIAFTVLGFGLNIHYDPVALLLLVVLAAIAELFLVDVYSSTTISVSVAISFAAALIGGIPAVVLVSTVVALIHYIHKRPAIYKTAFNWATDILAGSVPALFFHALGIPLSLANLAVLALPVIIAAFVYFGIQSILSSAAIGLSQRMSMLNVWREQFRWLTGHYLALCFMGLILSIAYAALGPVGIIVFAIPIVMMRYSQKQYVDRTEGNMRDLRRMNQELQRMNQELAIANHEVITASNAIRDLNNELFLTLAKIIDARDPYVSIHATKVADYAVAIAKDMGLSPEQVEEIRQAGFFHDIGKIGISEQVLHKPGSLTEEEYDYVKAHVTLGGSFLETCQSLRHLAPYVRHHHERWDGTGYPDRLRGEQIPLEARILAVCDAVEAMVSDRPYHKAMPMSQVLDEIKSCAGSQFDPAVVGAFERIVQAENDIQITNSAEDTRRKFFDKTALILSNNGWDTGQEPKKTDSTFFPLQKLA